MKAKASLVIISLFLLATPITTHSQDTQNELRKYDATLPKGPHHQRYSEIHQVPDTNGVLVSLTNQYTLLACGSSYWQDGNLVNTEESIELDGVQAAAKKGPHKAAFSADANVYGGIRLSTPEGHPIRFHVLGLFYRDPLSGQNTWIAHVQNASGFISPPNQVIYFNAMKGVKLDVRYGYHAWGLEQDIVLKEKLPTPESLGLSRESQVVLVTEFVEFPQPQIKPGYLRKINLPDLPESKYESDLRDDRIILGDMVFGPGRAFLQEQKSPAPPKHPKELQGRLMGKQWIQDQGRSFLLEVLDFKDVEEEIATLPERQEMEDPSPTPNREEAGPDLTFPPAPLRELNPKQTPMQLAQVPLSTGRGYILDFQLVVPIQGMTFRGDTTYYVTNRVYLTGYTTIEGGSIVKFGTNYNNGLTFLDPVSCNTGPFRPALFTREMDQTVGDDIYFIQPPGPEPGEDLNYGTAYLHFYTGPVGPNALNYCYFRFLRHPVVFDGITTGTNYVRHCQFYKAYTPLYANNSSDISVQNCLFYEPSYCVVAESDYASYQIKMEHATIRGAQYLRWSSTGSNSISLSLTNCILFNIANLGPYTGAPNVITSDPGIFLTSGQGTCYLQNSHPLISYTPATTNLSPQLLKDLQGKASALSMWYLDSLSPYLVSSGLYVLDRQNIREPYLRYVGYHYEAVDYLCTGVGLGSSSTLILTNGACMAFYPYSQYGYVSGLSIASGSSSLLCEGTVEKPGWLVDCQAFQEVPVYDASVSRRFIVGLNSGTIQLRGYKSMVIRRRQPISFFQADNYTSFAENVLFQDCEFNSAIFKLGSTNPLSNLACQVNNCFFNGCTAEIAPLSLQMYNTTHRQGSLRIFNNSTSICTLRDNLFDLSELFSQNNGQNFRNNNAFVGTNVFSPAGSSNVYLSWSTNSIPLYERGDLGDYYHSRGSPFINAGSRLASTAGLYHYTTRIDPGKETNSVVDIGYHYVATESDGQVEVPKSLLTVTASSELVPNSIASVIDGSSKDPYWQSQSAADTNRCLQIDLGQPQYVSKISYYPRINAASGSFLEYEVYVTDSPDVSSPLSWGLPKAMGFWSWPVGEEKKSAYLEPYQSWGRYVLLRAARSINQVASATEVWVYTPGNYPGGEGLPMDNDKDGRPDYIEDRNGNGQVDAGEYPWTRYNDFTSEDLTQTYCIPFTPFHAYGW